MNQMQSNNILFNVDYSQIIILTKLKGELNLVIHLYNETFL